MRETNKARFALEAAVYTLVEAGVPSASIRREFDAAMRTAVTVEVEAPVSPPENPKQELPTADDVRGILKGYERYDPEARVEELEAALRQRDALLAEGARLFVDRGSDHLLYEHWYADFEDWARRALRGSVPEGENG